MQASVQEISEVLDRYRQTMDRIDDDRLIRHTLALYGPLLDDRRFEEWGDLFTEDAEWTIPGFSFKGRAAVVAGVGAMEPPAPGWVKHFSYPPVIQLDSPSTARAWSDLAALVKDPQTGAWSIAAAGRYYDDLEKKGGAWRFKRRQADIDTAANALRGLDLVPTISGAKASSYAVGGHPMTYRLALWGTGLVGSAAGRKIIELPELELVACHAFSPSKIDQDVGALVGAGPTGIKATGDIEAIIAAKPDCVLYVPLVWSVDDMARLLEAGINVISTANFITGRSFGEAAVAKLDDAAKRGGVSLYGTGINPGLLNIVALATTAACAKVRKIVARESVDATLYASKDTWVSLGFGGPPDAPSLAEKVKQRSLVFIDAVEMMANALKVKIDDIGFLAEFATATGDLDLGWMDINKGTVCGLQMTYSGLVKGKSVIDLQLMWRLGKTMIPDWRAEGYVIEIDGEPNVHLRFEAQDLSAGGGATTAMNAVHAIAAVCAARPGIVTAAELPVIVAAGCVEPR